MLAATLNRHERSSTTSSPAASFGGDLHNTEVCGARRKMRTGKRSGARPPRSKGNRS
jgi:hypothetical protein